MAFRDTLIANGYRKQDLKDLSQDDLALLVQEEHIENTWSPEARAAAIAKRVKRVKGKTRTFYKEHFPLKSIESPNLEKGKGTVSKRRMVAKAIKKYRKGYKL